LTGYEVHIARCIFWNKVGSATIKLRSFDDNKAVKRTILTKRAENNLKKLTLRKEMKKRFWTLKTTWTMKSETLDSGLGEDSERVKF
jgi:hypothetical protein